MALGLVKALWRLYDEITNHVFPKIFFTEIHFPERTQVREMALTPDASSPKLFHQALSLIMQGKVLLLEWP